MNAGSDARIRIPKGEVFHSLSRGLCPECHEVVDGQRLIRDAKVYLRKFCPEHGVSEALISGDAEWWLRSLRFARAGSVPLALSTEVSEGCPSDCGLCPDHEQHSCLPIIEITDHCDLDCPICLVQNEHSYQLSREQFADILDGLIEKEGSLETINISGGEPTLHPEFLELLDMALARPEISRVSVSTHGLRLASDYDLCEQLAERGVYVSLQLDARQKGALSVLRGSGDHLKARERALTNLERAGVRTTLVATLARGVNEEHLSDCIDLLYEKDFILSLMFQPAAYVGQGGAKFSPHDPLDVLTIPDVVKLIAEQSRGRLRADDFLPLPCSHPSCFALTYLLSSGDSFVPFPRFIDMDRYLQLISNRGTIRPDEEFEDAIRDTIDEMWSSSAQVPDSDKILRTLKKAIMQMYPEDRAVALEQRLRIGEGLAKTIFIHAFMDAHTFELERIKKCCTHYALPDGRLMPGCAYNNIHRGEEASR